MKPYSYVFLLFGVIILTCINCIRGERQEPISMEYTTVDSNGSNQKNEMHLSGFQSSFDTKLDNAEDTISAVRYLMDLRTLPNSIDSIRYFYYGPKLTKGVTIALDSVKLYLHNGNTNTLAPRNHDGMDFPYFLSALSLDGYDLQFRDFNFDFNQDIAITTWASGASGNTVNDIYLFNAHTGGFEFSNALSGLASIYLNPKRKLIGERPTGGGFDNAMLEYRLENDSLFLQSSLKDSEINNGGEFMVVRDVYHLIDDNAITYSDTFSWFSVAQDPSDFQSPWKSIGHIRWVNTRATSSSELFNRVSELDDLKKSNSAFGYLHTSPVSGKEIYLKDLITNNKLLGIKAYEIDNDNHLREHFIEIYSFNSEEELSSGISMSGKTRVYEDFDSIIYIFFDSRSSINFEGKIIQCNHPVTYNLSTCKFE